jgi:cytochrome P450
VLVAENILPAVGFRTYPPCRRPFKCNGLLGCIFTLEPLMQVTEADLMRAIAYPLPMRVIAEMLGIPHTMETWLLTCTDVIARFFGAPNQHGVETLRRVERAVLELMHFFREATAERRKHKGNDLISLLLEIEEDGEFLTEEEVHAQCVMLLFGGHETTRNLLGNGIHTLLRHPAETEELRENPWVIRTGWRSCFATRARCNTPREW